MLKLVQFTRRPKRKLAKDEVCAFQSRETIMYKQIVKKSWFSSCHSNESGSLKQFVIDPHTHLNELRLILLNFHQFRPQY